MSRRVLAALALSTGIAALGTAALAQTAPGSAPARSTATGRSAPDVTGATGGNVLGPGKDSPGPAGQMGGSGGTTPAPTGSSLGGAAPGAPDTVRRR